jgi:hypothetical protein
MAAEDAEKRQHVKSQAMFVAYRENPHPNLAKNARLGWGTQSFFPNLSYPVFLTQSFFHPSPFVSALAYGSS